MKRYGILCVLFMLLLAAVLPAAADVLWTPLDDFLSQCHYLIGLRSFIAAGKDGWIEAVDLPFAPSEIRRFPNGTEFLIETICGKKDDEWAEIRKFRYPWSDKFENSGEVFGAMKDLVQGYDSQVFAEAYRDELQPFEEDFDFCSHEPFEVRMTPDSSLILYEADPQQLWPCRDGQDFKTYYHISAVYVDKNRDRWVPLQDGYLEPGGWINIGQAEGK